MLKISQPKLFKFLLVGLPVGLVITIIIALLLYYTDPSRDGVSKDDALRFAAPVSEQSIKNTVTRLSETVGARSLSDEPDAMNRARKFVQSSLGADNMGYNVRLDERMTGGVDCPTVIAELPGRGRANEIVVIAAPYTSAVGSPGAGRSASGVAAMLALAKAMTGSEQQRTVRFAAFAAESADPEAYDISAAVRNEEGRVIIAVINLDTTAFPLREGGVWEASVPMKMYHNESALANEVTTRFARGTGLRLTPELVAKTSASQRSAVPFLTLTADVADSPAGSSADVTSAYDYSRTTQAIQALKRLVDRFANPDGV